MEKIISIGLVVMAVYTLFAVLTPNHLYIGQEISLKFLFRGLYALSLTLIIHTNLSAEYLYKDEVIFNPAFQEQVEILGSELHQKTGISLKLLMLKELPNETSMVAYEQGLMKDFNSPTILLTFSEMNHKVDILAYL